jgi:2-octaprenyl-6-methoxyphenol hydroxylase
MGRSAHCVPKKRIAQLLGIGARDKPSLYKADARVEDRPMSHTGGQRIRTEILIAGGGMVGMATAIGLAQAGIDCVVVDVEAASQQMAEAYDGRSSAIAYGSQQALKSLGIWPGMADAAEPILDIRVSDGRPGEPAAPLFLHYDHLESGLDAPFGAIVENRATRRALLARLAELPQVKVIAPARVAGLAPGAGLLTASLEGGPEVVASLVVAADGARSALRTKAGIGVAEFNYAQTGIVCTVTHELAHEGVAHEHFLPAGPFAMLPMTDHEGLHRSSIVWTERRDLVPALLALDDDSFSAEIERRFGDTLGRIRVLGRRWSYPLRLIHAESYVANRLVLIGDAAHAIHPIAGQGLNLGLRDVAALAEVLADAHRLGLDMGAGDVLADYQRWRRFDTMLLIAVTDSLNRLFSNDVAPIRLLRDAGLGIVNRMAPVKRLLMRHAMGAAGSRPRLLRGLPL